MSPRHAKDAANNWETPRPRGECARTAAPQEAGDDADESEKEKDDVDGVHTCESAPRAALERRRKCQVQDAKGQAAQQTYDPLSACKKKRAAFIQLYRRKRECSAAMQDQRLASCRVHCRNRKTRSPIGRDMRTIEPRYRRFRS